MVLYNESRNTHTHTHLYGSTAHRPGEYVFWEGDPKTPRTFLEAPKREEEKAEADDNVCPRTGGCGIVVPLFVVSSLYQTAPFFPLPPVFDCPFLPTHPSSPQTRLSTHLEELFNFFVAARRFPHPSLPFSRSVVLSLWAREYTGEGRELYKGSDLAHAFASQ